MLFISHDRAFLDRIATRIVELDRGRLISFPGDYLSFLEKREQLAEDEKTRNALFDKKLAEEEVWIRQGIKARRTRNEGRVRALLKLRELARRAHRTDAAGADLHRAGGAVGPQGDRGASSHPRLTAADAVQGPLGHGSCAATASA